MAGGVMVQFEAPDAEPSLADAALRLGVPAEALDADFGVIATSPAEKLYTVLVDEGFAAEAGVAAGPWPGTGAFSNPGIDTFGPPEG